MRDARVASPPFVMEGQRLTRMDEEHRVQVLAHVLHQAHGEVLLGDRVRIGGRGRPVIGVGLDPQRVPLERAVGLLSLEGADSFGQDGVRQPHAPRPRPPCRAPVVLARSSTR